MDLQADFVPIVDGLGQRIEMGIVQCFEPGAQRGPLFGSHIGGKPLEQCLVRLRLRIPETVGIPLALRPH